MTGPLTPAEPRRAADERLVAVAGVVAIAALVWHHMAILGDGFWYIATGRLLVAQHRLPPLDPFTFASVRDGWRNVSTGSEVLFALVADRLGLRALMLLATLVETAAVALLWLGSSRSTLTRLCLLPVALLFVQVDAEDLSARGQVFGDLGFVVLLLLLLRLRDGRRISWLAPLVLGAVWVNVHLSFLLAVVVPLSFAGALWLEPRAERPRLAPFLVFAGSALLGSLVNPYGYGYLVHALRCAFDPVVGMFDLFQSPNLHSPGWLLAPALALVLVLARCFFGPRSGARAEVALLVALLTAACSSRRYVTELLALEALVAGPLLDRLRLPARLPAWGARSLNLASSLLLLGASAPALGEHKDPLHDVPAAAARFVHEHALPENVMNPYHWGGYLAYAWAGHPQYFIDGRDIFGLVQNGILDDSIRLQTDPTTFERILDAYEIETVLWERYAPLSSFLAQHPAWHLAYQDPIAVIYTRESRHRPAPPN